MVRIPGTLKDECELHERNVEGGLLYWGPRRYMRSRALEMGVCFHRGLVLGNMEGRSFSRAFEKSVKCLFIRRTFIE